MELLFDRYVPRGGARHLDLATGRLVGISVRDVPADDWRRRWRVRVEALLDGCEGLERLVDAGEAGAHSVFEVRALAPLRRAAPRDASTRVALAGIAWLGARRLSTGPCHRGRLLACGALRADLQTAWPIETSRERIAAARDMRAWHKLLGPCNGRVGCAPVPLRTITVPHVASIDDEGDGRAGLVPLHMPAGDAVRCARVTGLIPVSGAIEPAQLPADYLSRHSFIVIEPAHSAAARWAAALACTGGRRHFFVPRPERALIARERQLAYSATSAPAAAPSPGAPHLAPLPARRLLARARAHFASRRLAPAIRAAGRAALIAGERTSTHAEAVLLKAQALRCRGDARAAGALLQSELRGHGAAATAAFLTEAAEAACDLALLEQAEAFARAAVLAAVDAAAQRRARLALDRARVWRGEAVDTDFWRARAAWHLSGVPPRWPARLGYPHAPCGALAAWEHTADRLERALWRDSPREAARLKSTLARVSETLPALLRARAAWLISGDGSPARRLGARGVLHTGKAGAVMEIFEHMSALLSASHESSSDEATLQAAAVRTRRILRARSVAVYAAGRPLPIAGDGEQWNVPSALAARCSEAAHTAGPEQAGGFTWAAVSVRGPDGPTGALVAAWPLGAAVEHARARLLLEAAALVVVPVLRCWPSRDEASARDDMPEIVGLSPALAGVRESIRRVSRVPFAVLIEGESGAGKELVARAVHRLSPRASRPFRALNCAAMAEELVEAELFGHAQGAYTGAATARAGLFEDADRGTLFLDEVSELSPRAQAKLLRVLQEGEVRRVGETSPRRVDVRIVAATNRPLGAAVAAHAFRADLFFRLDVLRIVVPPLRARPQDIPVLCAHFWRDAAARAGTSAMLSAEALGHLAAYGWPGNVRELQNVIAAMAVSGPRRGRAGAEHVPAHIRGDAHHTPQTLQQARAALDRDLVRSALARAGGRPARAAAELGLSRQGFAKLMRRLGLPAA